MLSAEYKVRISKTVTIEESLPLKKISVWRQKDLNQAKNLREDITHQSLTHDSKNSPTYAYIDINRNNAQNNGKDWKFQVQYDVQRPRDGNN